DVLGEFTGPQELQEHSVIPLELRLLLPEPQFTARKADRLLAGVAGVDFQEPQDPLLGFPQHPSPAVVPLEDFVDLPLNKVIDGLNLAFDPAVFGQQPGRVVGGLGHPALLPDVLWLGLGLEFAVKFQRHVPSPHVEYWEVPVFDLGHLATPSLEQTTAADKAGLHLHQMLAAPADDASGLPRPERHQPGLGVVKQLYPLPGVDSQFPTDLLGDDDPPEIIRLQNNPRLVKHATTSMY